ncbi:MAG TPA: histidine kinase [Actinomycetota bacterium]
MTARTGRVAGWTLLALSLVLTLASFVLVVGVPERTVTVHSSFESYATPAAVAAFGVTLLTFSAVGALILSRRPRNGIGWLFAIDGALMALMSVASAYAVAALADGRSSLLGEVAGWIPDILYLPLLGTLTAFLFLLFPDGRLRTRPERTAAVVTAAGVSLGALAVLFEPNLYSFPDVENPLGITGLETVYLALAGLGGVLLFGGLIASIALLVGRLRQSAGRERDQLRILVASAIVATVLIVPVFFAPDPGLIHLVVSGVGVLLIPVSVGFAILRHRLFDIDLAISKTLVFGLLAAFIAIVYVGVVVAIPAAVLGRGGEGVDVLPFVAAALIALAFQPVRERARRLAARLVYGDRASPYEVLSSLAERMGETYAADDLLPRIARSLAEGVGADRADVWLRIGDQLRPAASWPSDGTHSSVALAGEELPNLPAQRAVAVRHRGELLGALTVDKRPTEPLSTAEDRLLEDVASQSGLALQNVRLTEELRGLIEELRASRQRLVKAQDQERRKLERDIHDGAQQQLVALQVKQRLAEQLAGRDPAKAQELLRQLQAETGQALEELRDLARGIFPPLLADQGLSAALRAQARKATLPAEVHADGVGRYPQEVEATVYFCCLEALQNATKYAGASSVRITLEEGGGVLTFEVADDGGGFDPSATARGSGLQNMADRLEAVGGSLEIRSGPGTGTTIAGRIPVREVATR